MDCFLASATRSEQVSYRCADRDQLRTAHTAVAQRRTHSVATVVVGIAATCQAGTWVRSTTYLGVKENFKKQPGASC